MMERIKWKAKQAGWGSGAADQAPQEQEQQDARPATPAQEPPGAVPEPTASRRAHAAAEVAGGDPSRRKDLARVAKLAAAAVRADAGGDSPEALRLYRETLRLSAVRLRPTLLS